MTNYAMDIDMVKLSCTMPKIEDVKKELFYNMNDLLARGLKTSFQWYVFQNTCFKNVLSFTFVKIMCYSLPSGLQIFCCH